MQLTTEMKPEGIECYLPNGTLFGKIIREAAGWRVVPMQRHWYERHFNKKSAAEYYMLALAIEEHG